MQVSSNSVRFDAPRQATMNSRSRGPAASGPIPQNTFHQTPVRLHIWCSGQEMQAVWSLDQHFEHALPRKPWRVAATPRRSIDPQRRCSGISCQPRAENQMLMKDERFAWSAMWASDPRLTCPNKWRQLEAAPLVWIEANDQLVWKK